MFAMQNKGDSPSWIGADLVQLLVTKLTKVVIWCLVLVEYAHAASMLPDTTLVALDEQSARLFRNVCSCSGVLGQRRAWIILLAANTACDVPTLYDLVDSSAFSLAVVVDVSGTPTASGLRLLDVGGFDSVFGKWRDRWFVDSSGSSRT